MPYHTKSQMLDSVPNNKAPALHAALHLCLHGHTAGTAIPPMTSDGFVPWRLQRGLQLAQHSADMLHSDWRGLELVGDVHMYD